MLQSLFEHSGSKIKSYAKILLAVEAVLTAIALMVILVIGAASRSDDFFLIFLIVLVGCAITLFFSYIVALFVYAFGELVEETAKQSGILERGNALLERMAPAINAPHAPAASAVSAGKPEKKPETAPAAVVHEGQVRCPQCGTVQSQTREKCYMCDTPLKEK